MDGYIYRERKVTKRCVYSPSVLLESWAPGSSVSSILSNVGEGFRVVNEGMQQAVGEVCEGIKQKKKVLASTIFDMSIKMFLR